MHLVMREVYLLEIEGPFENVRAEDLAELLYPVL